MLPLLDSVGAKMLKLEEVIEGREPHPSVEDGGARADVFSELGACPLLGSSGAQAGCRDHGSIQQRHLGRHQNCGCMVPTPARGRIRLP
jgi:hypothetical protein